MRNTFDLLRLTPMPTCLRLNSLNFVLLKTVSVRHEETSDVELLFFSIPAHKGRIVTWPEGEGY